MYIIFTGNGKGKTTAALGYALRALGTGRRVLMVEFIKGPWMSGEDTSVKAFKSKFKLVKTGKGFVGILNDKLPWIEHQRAAQKGVELAAKEIASGRWEVVILDEIHVAIALKLVAQADLIKLVEAAHSRKIDIVATGREAAPEQIALADMVTEMREIKHPFQSGVAARAGVEF